MLRTPSPRTLAVCALLTTLAFAPPLFGGAWTPERGRTYLKLSANLFKSDANYNAAGDRVDPFEDFPDQYAKFRDENLSLYFEHGLTDRLAVFGSFTYKDIEQSLKNAFLELSLGNDDFADFDLGLRYQLTEGPNVWALAFTAKLPYLYDEDDDIPLGNGQEDYEVRGLYGRSLGRGFYGGLEAGYRFRTEDPSDEWRFLGELGWSYRRFYARTKLDLIRSVDELDTSSPLANPLINPAFDLTKLELTAGLSLNKTWYLEYTYTDTLDGKNTAEGFNNQWALVASF
ncbi:hypothetical protein SCOR_29795 [Sulfidibacter corallicola]|uniref:DUF481 domain-containing protein n=1 Tax=Sulfidibacter corallicola TaxID=2818388 RepID=A0A8A4TMX9_SULCO|nr:hypothetical protein [Sulfidibacter corallicola]QTD50251.1 hypothetical protein J3U87_32095 [Sulfidibacter corallicola]